MNELDAPLGLDRDGQDRAHNRAAIAVFGVAGLAIVATGLAWFGLRQTPVPQALIELPAPAAATVALDAPVLRPELREEAMAVSADPGRSITIIDGKTGKRETILVGPDPTETAPAP